MPSQQEEQEEIKRLSSRLENIQEQHNEHQKELKVHENEIRVIENNYEEDIPKLYDLVKQLQKQHDDFKTLVLDKLVDDLKKSYHDQYTVFKHKISTDIDTIKKSYHRYDNLQKEIDDLKKSYRQNKQQQHTQAQGQGQRQGSYTDLKKEILELRQKYNYLKKNMLDDDFKKIKKSYQEHKTKTLLHRKNRTMILRNSSEILMQ
jgi:chromosome segregation ATPase